MKSIENINSNKTSKFVSKASISSEECIISKSELDNSRYNSRTNINIQQEDEQNSQKSATKN